MKTSPKVHGVLYYYLYCSCVLAFVPLTKASLLGYGTRSGSKQHEQHLPKDISIGVYQTQGMTEPTTLCTLLVRYRTCTGKGAIDCLACFSLLSMIHDYWVQRQQGLALAFYR